MNDWMVKTWILSILLLAVLGCAEEQSGHGSTVISVTASALSKGDIDRIAITVSGSRIDPQMEVMLPGDSVNGWRGTIEKILTGDDLVFTARAFAVDNREIYRGVAENVTILKDQTAQVIIMLHPVDPAEPFQNAVPRFDSIVVSKNPVMIEETIDIVAAASDPDDDVLTFEWAAEDGELDPVDSPQISWRAPSVGGTYSFIAKVTDSKGAIAMVTFSIEVMGDGEGSADVIIDVNTSPAALGLVPYPSRIDVGETTILDLTVEDAEGDALTYAWNADCQGSFNDPTLEDPSFTLVADNDNRDCRLSVNVTDGRGGQNTATIDIATGTFPGIDIETDTDGTGDTETDTVTTYDDCGEEVLDGDHTILNADDIAALAGYTYITGSLNIKDTLLTNLAGLEELRCIGMSLNISGNTLLSDMKGLSGLIRINEANNYSHGLIVDDNGSLRNLDGLQNLNVLNSKVVITENSALENLQGLNGLTAIKGLGSQGIQIKSNPNLTSLTGLDNLASIDAPLYIYGNNKLDDLTGLDSLKYVGHRMTVSNNAVLESLQGLGALETLDAGLTVSGNTSLNSLEGVGSLSVIKSNLIIENNGSLKNLSGLQNLATVDGLTIATNQELESLSGLDSLALINGNLDVRNNRKLVNLTGLSRPTKIAYVYIRDNAAMKDLVGLSGVIEISGLSVERNPLLETLDGMTQLTNIVSSVTIGDNPKLLSIEGLSKVTSFDRYTSLTIRNNDSLPSVVGLGALSSFSLGNVTITGNGALLDLDGLSGVTSVGSLNISDNDKLENLSPLSELISITHLMVSENDHLVSFAGLQNVGSVGQVRIEKNAVLSDLKGLMGLSKITSHVYINENPSLLTLSGLENLSSLGPGNLQIANNDALTSIAALGNITDFNISYLRIMENDSLENLAGLEKLTGVTYDLNIDNNGKLANLDGLDNLCDLKKNLYVRNNPALPTCEATGFRDRLLNQCEWTGTATIEGNNDDLSCL